MLRQPVKIKTLGNAGPRRKKQILRLCSSFVHQLESPASESPTAKQSTTTISHSKKVQQQNLPPQNSPVPQFPTSSPNFPKHNSDKLLYRHSSFIVVLLYSGILSNAFFSRLKTALHFHLTRVFQEKTKKKKKNFNFFSSKKVKNFFKMI